MGFLDYSGLAKVWSKIKSNFILKSSVSAKSTTLTWDTETEIANIDGKSIKIKIPSNPNTNTTYTFAEGTTNGAFSVTPSSGTTQSVPVHGVVTKVNVGATEYNPSSAGLVLLPAYPTKASWNYDEVYLKLEAETSEQTIKNTTSNMSNGAIEIWRGINDGYPMIGFATGTTKTKLGFLGFGTVANQPILRTTGGVDYNLIHAGNYTTYCATSTHTHDTTIASSTETNQLTLANGGKYSLTAGGTSYVFTMPAGTGSTDSDSKLYLVGATTQAASTVTYSDSEVYTTNGTLTTKSVQVGGGSATIRYNSTNQCIEFVFI